MQIIKILVFSLILILSSGAPTYASSRSPEMPKLTVKLQLIIGSPFYDGSSELRKYCIGLPEAPFYHVVEIKEEWYTEKDPDKLRSIAIPVDDIMPYVNSTISSCTNKAKAEFPEAHFYQFTDSVHYHPPSTRSNFIGHIDKHMGKMAMVAVKSLEYDFQCKSNYKLILHRCIPVCDCSEKLVNGECIPAEPKTTWDASNKLYNLYPDNNHSDADRCVKDATEKDGLPNTCEKSDTTTKDPIDCATGQKKYFETDYQGFGLDALSYSRLYETPLSSSQKIDSLMQPTLNGLGSHWQPRDVPSLSRIDFDDGAYSLVFKLGNRIERIFFFPAGSTTYTTNASLRSIVLAQENGRSVVTLSGGERYVFNNTGTIAQDEDQQGTVRYIYTWETINGEQKISQIKNRFGRFLNYSYNDAGQLKTLTDQDGVQVHYQYDANNNLSKVIYPDATPADLTDNPSKTYLFENADFTDYVTGIINQDGTRIANIDYNADGKATLSELYNGTDRVEVSYPKDGLSVVKFYRDVAQSAYREEQYSYGQFRGRYRLTRKEIIKCDHCDLSTETWEYNDRELLARHTSPAGIVTEYGYDADDRKTSVIVGVGTPEANKTHYTWNDTYNQIETITTATDITTYTFDADGNNKTTVTTPRQ